MKLHIIKKYLFNIINYVHSRFRKYHYRSSPPQPFMTNCLKEINGFVLVKSTHT